MTRIKDIVFVMDAPKEDEKVKGKKAKNKNGDGSKTSLSIKNFGARVDISKLKSATSNFELCWRCRFDAAGDGTKTLMPIRPTMCLAGSLEIDEAALRLM